MNSPLKLPKDLVTALRAGDVQLYLTSRGWVSEPFGPAGKGLLFRHPSTSQIDLLLPLTRDLGDFATRMAELVANLSAFERRPVWELLNDLSTPPGDVLRFRVAGSVAVLGQLPLDEGIKLLQGGRDLLRSSATSLQRPAALQPLRADREVNAFLNDCRLGQTERGSFVATIIAPVPPVVETQMTFLEEEPRSESEPYARQVTTRLMSSLGLVSEAIRASAPGRILEGVPQGVSANLCEAVVAMKPPGDESRLDIQVTWARSRPSPPGVPQTLSFPKEDFAVIEEAGRQLRTRAFAKRERYEGPVMSVQKALRSFYGNVAGRMVLATEVGGVSARVKVDLEHDDFIRACDALRDGYRVAVTGIIRHDVKAREYILSEPSDFEVLSGR
jgi:hypothetical protein